MQFDREMDAQEKMNFLKKTDREGMLQNSQNDEQQRQISQLMTSLEFEKKQNQEKTQQNSDLLAQINNFKQ